MNPRVDELFLAQARRRPDDIAVTSGSTSITFGQLAERATAIAGGLADLGVRRESLVGIAFDRSPDAIVAILAVTLAGGAYVPLNPAFPASRVKELLADSGVRLVVGDPAGCAKVADAASDGVRVMDLYEVPRRPGYVTPPAPPDRSPLAYVMFTSGSTGRPKGVLVEHRGIVRLVRDPDYAEFGVADRFAQLSALEFDASTLEIWGALLNGARLYIVDTETAVVPWRLAEALRTNEITVAWLTSALFNQLADEDPGMFAPLRCLFTGGDVLSPRHVELVRARHPDLALYNGYGPTENTTFTTVHRIRERCDRPIPIGRPIRGTTALVLDDERRPLPPGVVGELYAGGTGVARGYLNNEELTRKRFVLIGGERYYRTGDRVHVDADGVLHFHGRTDGQVKIRGHRIELGEVTAALRSVPGVADCHVSVAGPAHHKHLVAYLVAPKTSERTVRTAVAAKLPRYTLPDQYVWLTRLPLNGNGKVDVAALPRTGQADRADQTADQHQLAELWGDVLSIDPGAIGPNDRFLEIGGNSIALGALLGRIHRRWGRHLSFADAAAAPTLATMTRAIATASVRRELVEPIPPSAGAAVDLHPQQVGLYALWQADPDSLAYNIPVRLTLRGPLDVARLRSAFTVLLQRHDALRMRLTPVDGAVRQVALEDLTPEFEYLSGPVADPLAGFVRPFRLDRPPLLRARLVHRGPDENELYLDGHHIVLDGVSLRVLVRDLFDLYAGTEPAAAATTFAAAAKWCRARQVTDVDEEFWRAELTGAPAGLELPTDRPRGRSRATRGAVVRRTLPAPRLAVVDQTARRLGATPFAVLATAYTATLARLSGQHDLVIGTPASGRTHPALESVVGMFVGTVCLRAELAGDTDLAGLARQLGARQWQALTHQDFPFERLVDRLDVPRDPARNPVFDALFAYQDLDVYELATADLAISVELLNPGTTRFDLNLQVYRRPDRLVLDLEYATELFDPTSADYLLDEYLVALDELCDDPGTPVFSSPGAAMSAFAADFAF
ncbi:MAG: amino acid adenylation domain-containing protein [Actinophytocola sp.]|uniref:amino acid adenylation domain-containing protein n=1 Tax=Actinophytocola sp. TaxID=1872138 RepID=UPI003D6A79D7